MHYFLLFWILASDDATGIIQSSTEYASIVECEKAKDARMHSLKENEKLSCIPAEEGIADFLKQKFKK